MKDKQRSDFHYELHDMYSVHEDQIACGRASIDANRPTEDARDYILVLLSKLMEEVLVHCWRDVIEAHAEPFEAHVRQDLDHWSFWSNEVLGAFADAAIRSKKCPFL
jgi:hypothetical protein